MKSTRFVPTPCPYCLYNMDSISGAGHDSDPNPGDVSLCISCGEWLVVAPGLTFRKPTDDELVEFAGSEACRRARAAWVYIRQRDDPARRTPERDLRTRSSPPGK